MHVFHQYGARRTGTNYTQALLEENFSNVMVLDNVVWKHDPIPKIQNFNNKFFNNYQKHYQQTCANRKDLYDTLANILHNNQLKTIVNIKDPYAWVESMWRYTRNIHLIEAIEVNSKYIFFNPKKRLSLQEDNVVQSIKSYNERYNQWCQNTTHLIRYEDVLTDHETVLSFFEQNYHLTRIHENLLNIKTGCDPTPVNLKYILPDWDYAEYYLSKKYLDNLPDNIIQVITQNINWDLFGRYGYEAI